MAAEAKRVLIVGAGSSGLTAIKACLEEGQTPVCLEKAGELGGLWNYTDGPSASGRAGIYSSLVINTSREMMAFSDFPVPDHFPHFLTHAHVMAYFRLYAQHFNLLRHIHFNTEVRHVRKAVDYDVSGKWTVTYVRHASDVCCMKCVSEGDTGLRCWCDDGANSIKVSRDGENVAGDDGQVPDSSNKNNTSHCPHTTGEGGKCVHVTEEYDGVMVCTGHHTVPHMPSMPGLTNFLGTVLHSQQYRRPEPFAKQRVLVVGIGNSAVDIATDLAKTAQQVYVSTRRGAWIITRTVFGGLPTDMLANSRVAFSLPVRMLQWGVQYQAKLMVNHDLLGLTPSHGVLAAHPTISDELPFQLMNRRVEIRPDISRILPHGVEFADGSTDTIDVIIMATGYDYRLDFVDPSVLKVSENRVKLFKYAMPPLLPHPTLAVIGLVQPIGSVMPIAELQCRWFVNLLLGRVRLPDKELMEKDIADKEFTMARQYYTSRRHTLQTPWIQCMDEIAEQFGARPNLWRILLSDPGLAVRCWLGPCLPAQYRLQGPKPWPHAATFIKQVWARYATRPRTIRNTSRKQGNNVQWKESSNGQAPEMMRTESESCHEEERCTVSNCAAKLDAMLCWPGGGRAIGETGVPGMAGSPVQDEGCPVKDTWSRGRCYTSLLLMIACCVFWFCGFFFPGMATLRPL